MLASTLTRLLRIANESLREAASAILKGGLVVYPKDTLDFIAMCGGSLVGTSANISGTPSIRRANEALKTFEGKVDLVLDGGTLSKRPESTVVRVTGKHVDILREGAVSRQEIVRTLKAKSRTSRLIQIA